MQRWTDRQRAMLAAMGVRTWAPEGGPPAAALPRAVTASPHAAAAAPPAPPVDAAAAEAPAVTVPHRPAPPAGAPPYEPGVSPVAGLDWPQLQARVEGCRACSLCESRRHTVFGTGHRQAQWMLVGEAPGEQEDLKGEPFVGPAGRLLDAMLDALGLTRGEAGADQQVYIANTLKCRPPQNRNPLPEELARCEPYLRRQIDLVQPRIIVAMGRFAVQSLLRTDEAIGRLRGRVHQYAGVPLIVTYHPAYLLRQPADKAKAWDDLCLAAREMSARAPDAA